MWAREQEVGEVDMVREFHLRYQECRNDNLIDQKWAAMRTT